MTKRKRQRGRAGVVLSPQSAAETPQGHADAGAAPYGFQVEGGALFSPVGSLCCTPSAAGTFDATWWRSHGEEAQSSSISAVGRA